jgi:hypothetical protein
MDTRIEKFTRAFFWVGYVVFLSASIPHVAAYFRHFDPVTSNHFEDISYWVIAVAIAVVIDVSDVLVSIAVIRAKANGATLKDTFLFWVFIFLIMALSWFFNWQYNVVFGTSQFQAVDSYTIANWVTIGQINPVIGSAFQLLILVYTLMAHKFAQKPREKTLEELMKEADEMEQKANYLARIEAVKQAESSRKWQARFEGIRQVKDEAIRTIKGEDEAVLEEAKPAEEIASEAQIDEPITDPIIEFLPVVEEAQSEQYTDEYNGVDNDEDNDLMTVLNSYPLVSDKWLAKGRKSASIDEIMAVTGHTKRKLNNAPLRVSSRNDKLILISSVLEWLKTAPKPEPKPQDTDPLPVTNGHRKVTQPLAEWVPLEV